MINHLESAEQLTTLCPGEVLMTRHERNEAVILVSYYALRLNKQRANA
jgi:hypothetical protein